jgi:hypothetical protein
MRKTKSHTLILFSALTFTFFCAQANAALQPNQQAQGEHTIKKEKSPDFDNYKVSYKVDEVENGKTINSRMYTLMAKIGSTATVRIGSRVPYSTGGKEMGSIQYQDVGMNIDCMLDSFGEEGRLIVHTKVSMMSLQGKRTEPSSESNPVFGQFQVENFTIAALGKPIFVGSADDVASNRRYVIEVTVTKAD